MLLLSALTQRVRAFWRGAGDDARTWVRAAEGELWHAFNLSLAIQRDLGAHFQDLRETRAEAARRLRAWVRAEAAGPVPAAEVRLAASRAVRLLQDRPFCFSAPSSEAPEAWARAYTAAYPDLPAALEALARRVDGTLGGVGAPARPLAGPFLLVRDRLAKAQEAAWRVRKLAARPAAPRAAAVEEPPLAELCVR